MDWYSTPLALWTVFLLAALVWSAVRVRKPSLVGLMFGVFWVLVFPVAAPMLGMLSGATQSPDHRGTVGMAGMILLPTAISAIVFGAYSRSLIPMLGCAAGWGLAACVREPSNAGLTLAVGLWNLAVGASLVTWAELRASRARHAKRPCPKCGRDRDDAAPCTGCGKVPPLVR